MDFPIFHLDFFGNRLLIAVIAIVHVFHNHPLAVGAIPVVAAMEWWGLKTGRPEWDRLAYRILFVCFILTTSVGALTGVGIWFSTSLVNPAAIGSLIRVFFWAWFFEWFVFVVEVVFILIYFLTWKKMQGERKGLHLGIGVALAVFSWITMAVITAILGFMMDPGSWMSAKSFLSGVFNPIYLPQLAFRTPLAMISAGMFALFLAYFFTRGATDLRADAVRGISAWVLAWLPLGLVGSFWYWKVVPAWMKDNVPVALTTQQFTQWHETALFLLGAMGLLVLVVCLWGAALPRWLPRVALLAPFVAALLLLGTFERIREFVRKPYVIGEYMYSNGIRAQDYDLLREEGILAHATYVPLRIITEENRVDAGREIFRIACTRCHTTGGVNAVTQKLSDMYGDDPWDRDAVKAYIQTMHNARPYMPPFPGTDREAGALADYLISLQSYPMGLTGAQTGGVVLPGSSPAPEPGDAAAAASPGG
jgi:hypothetical protein